MSEDPDLRAPFMPAHEASAHITHNQHKSYYYTVAEYEQNNEGWFKNAWVSEESRAHAIANNELWEMQWYPNTPIGFENICAGRWSDLVEYAKRKGAA